MRLAMVRQRYTPFGGAERFIERAIAALERNGASVTVITREWRNEDSRRALIVNPAYAGRLWRDASFARGVRAVLSHERIPGCDLYRAGDGVHRQWLDHRLKSAPLLERIGIRLNPYHWYVCAAERAMFEHPALRGVICNSRMVAAEIESYFPMAARKLHVIYNGVDLAHFNPERRSGMRTESRDGLGLSPEDLVFGFVGSGFARKGLALAIDALAATGRSHFHLLVAGQDRAMSKFAAQAARAGVRDQVKFVGAKEDVRFVYAASDCFILPTRYDPFPNAALEALAMGVPAIVSTQCGAAEIIEAGRNGWICDPGAVGLLAGLMTQFEGAPRDRLGAAARATAESFGIDKMAGVMTNLYARLLDDDAAPLARNLSASL
jgi:UDP-glucose:(heptosyl)LPS alpha-1,3-glucosyltransferase